MRRFERWLPMLGITAFGLAQAFPMIAAPLSKTLPIMTIHVSNYAGVDAKELAEAERVATSVFKEAGVTATWMDARDISAVAYSDQQDVETPRLSQIRLHIQILIVGGLAWSVQ